MAIGFLNGLQAIFFRYTSVASDPASPQDGDIWYSTATNTFRARENGTTKNVIGAGGGSPGGTSGQVQINSAGAFAGATTDQLQIANNTNGAICARFMIMN